MANLQITTTQNVNLEYTLAGVGERILAFLVDGGILLLYALLVSQIADTIGVVFDDGWTGIGLASLMMLPAFCYSLVLQSIFNGQTVGKMILKIRVVRRDGAPVQFSNYLVRWMLRLVDIWLFFGSIGLLSMLFSEAYQRIGDAAAGTVVVNNKRKTRIDHTILEELEQEYSPVFPQVTRLSDRDVRLIKEIYGVARRSGDYGTLKALREKVEGLLQTGSDLYDKPYLDAVLKDYSYYTRG
ncbi:RDD family protein [Robiginitalea sp. M366]|uniref:RDD family protein n=1 Tax=Robiginitalea aestuariiviva TaxID=3036903 RepID=UPI00240D6D4B|nr:RDD family protein [Robiginitalea aestuariiviva]MDG1572572.1 RDD family protein [Robiginitalea aestuariiviva]